MSIRRRQGFQSLRWPSPATLLVLLAAAAALALTLAPGTPGALLPQSVVDRPLVTTTPIRGSFPVRYVQDPRKGPPVSAEAALLLEVSTGTVLYAKDEHQRRAPASTTKIITALLAIESGRLQDVVTVSRRAAGVTGSSASLSTGERYTLEELLHGLMLPSGNDAAVAIAEHVGGSVSGFAAMMNRRARELGAYDSHFVNPHGLDDPQHYTSAYDLALFARTAMQYPTFAAVVGRRAYTALSQQKTWHNTNRLLWSFEGATGIKTGTTSRAGNCLVAAASREGTQLIGVVLGSSDRWADSARLLEYGFSAFAVVELARRGDVVAEVPVAGASSDLVVRVMAADRLAVTVPVRQVKDVRGVVRLRQLFAPVGAGQPVGELEGYLADQPFARIPLVAGEPIPRLPWWRRIF
ncbi:MAG: D-alanyl-D-alanine carboxypeptidase [Limnochordaceae bacterium]|nr:D-alanyl-D-alanine carboxypeptidase [Limnochordaceae bacterium]